MNLYLDNWGLLVLAILTAVLGGGRLSRIIAYDAYPPAVWWRLKWGEITKGNLWEKLFTCTWCLTPWIMVIVMAWFWVGTLVLWIGVVWWVFWGWLALSYVASMVIARDEPE